MTKSRQRALYLGALVVVFILGVTVGVHKLSHQRTPSVKAQKSPQVAIHVSGSVPLATYRRDMIAKAAAQLVQQPPQHQMDASGFVQYVFSLAGIQLPRTVGDQSKTGTPITDLSKLQKGDIVFFSAQQSDHTVTFDGIYLGNHQFAAWTTHGLQVQAVNSTYWKPLFQFGVTVSQ